MYFHPFSFPLKWGHFKKVPDGVYDVKGLVRRIWHKLGVENQKRGCVIALDMGGAHSDVVHDANDVEEDDNPEDSREFTSSVRISFLERSRDDVNSSDVTSVCWSNEYEGSGSLEVYKGGVSNSATLTKSDGMGDGGSAGGCSRIVDGPLLKPGEELGCDHVL
jgi:hypothetical protein